jgi:hypothetical protein
MKRILFKTTIPPAEDDWHIGRFSLLLQQSNRFETTEAPSFSRSPLAIER